MDIDALLAKPPAPVQDDGFSRHVTLLLCRRRILRRMVALALVIGTLLALLVLVSAALPVAELPLQLASLVISPRMPWVAGGAMVVLLAFGRSRRPALLRR